MITVHSLEEQSVKRKPIFETKEKTEKTQVAFHSSILSFIFEASFETCFMELMLSSFKTQDSKRLESGVQFQNEAEIAGYILECENLLRQHVIDVQILIDGKYYQADQLVQR